MEEILRNSLKSHDLHGFLHPQGGCLFGISGSSTGWNLGENLVADLWKRGVFTMEATSTFFFSLLQGVSPKVHQYK